MPVLLVRHAKAGSRHRWEGDDRQRPLTDRGRLQAEALVGLLRPFPIMTVMTSGYVRCVQSVAPLAAALGLALTERSELAEGAGLAALDLFFELGGATAVLCTHGDVMVECLDELRERHGLPIPGGYPTGKACTWVLDGDGFPPSAARYLPAPA